MKLLLLPLFLSFIALSYGQKELTLKRKYFGNYSGQIPAYKVSFGYEAIHVDSTSIQVKIDADSLFVTVGGRTLAGTYKVMFEADKYYLLDATMESQLASERIMIYKRGKSIARDGLFPQPVTELKRTK